MTDLKTSLVIVDEVRGIDRSRVSHDQQHRLFYQHMLTVLGVDDWTRRTASIRGFGSLPDDIREQAGWGRILSDPEWGTLPPPRPPRKIPFFDITNAYERPAA